MFRLFKRRKVKVTKEQFHEYDLLLKSGLYKNMVDPEVAYVLGIDRRQHIYIMVHYEELKRNSVVHKSATLFNKEK